jgi:hypothetical protein
MTTLRTPMAFVHAPVLAGDSPAIYVARRDDGTWLVGGPNFTDDDPSRFEPLPFADLLRIDHSLLAVEDLPVGHCASRSEPSDSWYFGLVPVGEMFLVTYDARPSDSNPERDDLGGAIVNCWVVADSLDSAVLKTQEHLVESGWVIVDRVTAETARADDHDHNAHFRQAHVDGLVAVFHTYPREELELN